MTRARTVPVTGAARRFADFVPVAGDPLADIAILQDRAKTALVIKGGRVAADRRA